MSRARLIPWLVGGILAVVLAGAAGWLIGSGTAASSSEAEAARDDAHNTAYERALERVGADTTRRGLKAGRSRGIKAGRKIGEREGFDLGVGTAGLVQAQADADAAEAARVAAESALVDRQANCGAIPEAPDICPTSDELAEYEAAASKPGKKKPDDQ